MCSMGQASVPTPRGYEDIFTLLFSAVLCLLFTYSAEEYHGYAPKGDATCYLPPCIVAV